MVEVKVPALEPLQLKGIQEFLRSPGPCLTILLPSYRPGEQEKPMATVLKTYLQDAAWQLATRRIAESVLADLLAPLRQLTEAPEFVGGSHFGRAIFRSPDVFAKFDFIAPVKAGLTVGSCFNIRTVLTDLHLPSEFYLLKLSKKQVALIRYAGLRGEPVELPKGVPRTLDEALAFKPPDHDLEDRSASGGSAGEMHRIRFGTSSGRETQSVYLADFFKAVDRGVREILHEGRAPLILAGVDEDTAIYRSIITYSNLLKQSIHGSANTPLAEDELLRMASGIVRSDCIERAAAALTESREKMAPARFSTDVEAILRATAEGRVSRLYIDEGAQKLGVFQGARRGGRSDWDEEDLLNVAAVETILQGGLAFALPAAKMPDGAAMAALFRY
jgi:release factor family 3